LAGCAERWEKGFESWEVVGGAQVNLVMRRHVRAAYPEAVEERQRAEAAARATAELHEAVFESGQASDDALLKVRRWRRCTCS